MRRPSKIAMVDFVETALEAMEIASSNAVFSHENFMKFCHPFFVHRECGGKQVFYGECRQYIEEYFYSHSSSTVESVDKSKIAVNVMVIFIPMQMCMNLDRLWVKKSGNVFPQVILPQSTGDVDKFLPEKSLVLQILNVFDEGFYDVL